MIAEAEDTKARDARELIRRFGDKHAAVLLMEQQVAELQTKLAATRDEITKMSSHVTTAAAYLSKL
jgi:hypothetical protein